MKYDIKIRAYNADITLILVQTPLALKHDIFDPLQSHAHLTDLQQLAIR
jgi:hypothetical protein